jgi:hypothetical protein
MNSQDFIDSVTVDALSTAKTRNDLGISSLSVILLVANYMDSAGLAGDDFNPEWIEKLDVVDGIVSIFREIDAHVVKRSAS